MTDFNYQKAYCTIALPSFQALSAPALESHKRLCPLVEGLHQQKPSLNIPLTPTMESILASISTKDLAELARASYFVGHWKPSHTPPLPFANDHSESWKIPNVIDQVLQTRLSPLPRNIKIIEGVLLVTYSDRSCWLWEEFALATEENLETFKSSKLSFNEETLHPSAKALAKHIGDMWDLSALADIPENDIYKAYLATKKSEDLAEAKAKSTSRLIGLRKSLASAEKEYAFTKMCIENDIPVDNMIYYKHTNEIKFGWREPLTAAEASEIEDKLKGKTSDFDFKIRFNTVLLSQNQQNLQNLQNLR